MKLYMVHCGFYDGIYEGHTNLFVAAEDFTSAKIKVREEVDFKNRKMHVDGLQEITLVNGYQVNLIQSSDGINVTVLKNNLHRDL